jgi:hypothetical protein
VSKVTRINPDEQRTADTVDDGSDSRNHMHFAARFGAVMVEIDGPADEAAPLVAAVCGART